MQSVGEILREARHQKQVSLEDASRVTKVKVEILEQLESDDFDQMVSPTYTKGFLKLYAEYLGLNSQSVVNAYLSSQGGLQRKGLQVQTVAAAQRQRPELKLPLRSVVLLVGGLTVVVVGVFIGKTWQARHARKALERPVAAAPAIPKADFEPLYTPKKPEPVLLDVPK